MYTGKLRNYLVQSTALAAVDYAALERAVFKETKHVTSTTDEPIDAQMKRVEKAIRFGRWYGMNADAHR